MRDAHLNHPATLAQQGNCRRDRPLVTAGVDDEVDGVGQPQRLDALLRTPRAEVQRPVAADGVGLHDMNLGGPEPAGDRRREEADAARAD